jgi:hypothetical protein
MGVAENNDKFNRCVSAVVGFSKSIRKSDSDPFKMIEKFEATT